jgi:hypothetical protein
MLCQPQRVPRRLRHLPHRRLVEPLRPVECRIGLVPGDAAEIVDDVAARHHQDSPLSQRRQPPPQREMIVERLQRVDRQLHDRHVGFRVEVGEHAPRAVVDPPLVPVEPAPDRLNRLRHLRRHVGRARRRIVEVEQRLRKPVKIVDGARPRHRRHRARPEIPVRRHHEHRPRPRQSPPHRPPRLREAVAFERVHRAAMADEEGGHEIRHRRGSFSIARL